MGKWNTITPFFTEGFEKATLFGIVEYLSLNDLCNAQSIGKPPTYSSTETVEPNQVQAWL
jgi:hypothetical protein